jgi:TRAP-type mannitol/chloroaromatic compound transport system permease small subunit
MEVLKSIANFIDALNDRMGRFVSWVTTGLVAVVFVDVVHALPFNISFVFTQELEWHLFAFVFLMGAGYTLLYDGHVRVDIIYQRLSTKGQAWVNFVCCFVFLFPGCLFGDLHFTGFCGKLVQNYGRLARSRRHPLPFHAEKLHPRWASAFSRCRAFRS